MAWKDSTLIRPLVEAVTNPAQAINALRAKMLQASDIGLWPNGSPEQKAAALAATDLAGLVQTGAVPFAPASAGGTLGTFIGRKGIENLYKEGSQVRKNYDIAEALRDYGLPAKDIHARTGMTVWPNGEVTHEISDRWLGMKWLPGKFTKEIGKGRPITDTTTHPLFFDAYPDAATYTHKQMPLADIWTTEGAVDSGNKVLYVDYPLNGAGGSVNQRHLPWLAESKLKTLVHELQHIASDQEGFVSGGGPSMFIDNATGEKIDKYTNLFKTVNPRERLFGPEQQRAFADQSFMYDPTETSLRNILKRIESGSKLTKEHSSLLRRFLPHMDSDVQQALLLKLRANALQQQATDRYTNLQDELRARITSDRLFMNAKERRNSFPLEGVDTSKVLFEPPLREIKWPPAK